ncbi:Isochorismatase family protein [Penicillium canariense]|uniref:Isochorismatase family protein n=1 Tax=Penicillium canariense TaxID=189055 RepID=A0A9W9HLP2_9EURO|nr:Isochorismatase family protein [Penicillium canariense]KAJ5151279.1 Isochorismatase family protein [Penicillium canariense]
MGTTTLLILDIEKGTVDMLGNTGTYLQRLGSAVAAARSNNIKIVHVITAFRTGYPECHPSNSLVPAMAAMGKFQEGDWTTEIHPAVAPTKDEVVITKRRVSAFFGTELEMILRCFDTEQLVVAGIATSGAVLSTIRHASDLDYRITVLRDLCMDRDEEVHDLLMDKVFKGKTDVITGQEWMERISANLSA